MFINKIIPTEIKEACKLVTPTPATKEPEEEEDKLKGPETSLATKESEEEEMDIYMLISQLYAEPDNSSWNMPSYEATTSTSQVLDEEKGHEVPEEEAKGATRIDCSRSKGPQESETSETEEEIDEEIDEKKEDVGCRSLQEEMAVLLNPSLKYALCAHSSHRWEEGMSCSISPRLKEVGDYLWFIYSFSYNTCQAPLLSSE
uniref:Uncharacterized protein n=1 Tax=Tanacetum cinerariifolium TaxID=118510 RepID=A0A699KB80_TANCI|nr:hypothetical protein [Tanacetum cinerariifolium]